VKPASLKSRVPSSWRGLLADEFSQPYFEKLEEFLGVERREYVVYPPEDEVFSALKLTSPAQVKVLLLGQDPYHDEGQAHGLAFSVRPGIKPPPSLVNIFKELHNELGCKIPNNGYLVPWAKQGVLLLNAVLTVRAHQPNSHRNKGWEKFTDAVFRKVNDEEDSVVFMLWGGPAQKKAALVDTTRHVIVRSAQPTPLPARHGCFGSKPFSAANAALRAAGKAAIDWKIPDR